MKKVFALILCLVMFGCSSVNTKSTLPITKSERTVYLTGLPSNLEVAVEEMLDDRGWEVFTVLNSVEHVQGNITKKGQDRATFLIEGVHIIPDIWIWAGTIRVIDLRTGKRVSTYTFESVLGSTIVKEIDTIMNSIKVVN